MHFDQACEERWYNDKPFINESFSHNEYYYHWFNDRISVPDAQSPFVLTAFNVSRGGDAIVPTLENQLTTGTYAAKHGIPIALGLMKTESRSATQMLLQLLRQESSRPFETISETQGDRPLAGSELPETKNKQSEDYQSTLGPLLPTLIWSVAQIPEATDELIRIAIDDQDKRVRWSAILALGSFDHQSRRVDDTLTSILKGGGDDATVAAVAASRRRDPRGVNVLIESLKTPSFGLRLIALDSLSNLGSEAKGAVPAMISLASDLELEDLAELKRFPAPRGAFVGNAFVVWDALEQIGAVDEAAIDDLQADIRRVRFAEPFHPLRGSAIEYADEMLHERVRGEVLLIANSARQRATRLGEILDCEESSVRSFVASLMEESAPFDITSIVRLLDKTLKYSYDPARQRMKFCSYLVDHANLASSLRAYSDELELNRVLDILDSVTHRCHILETKGESYRLQDAKRRRRPTA